ncbi:unnamed protein product [Auanema sp. JU1783]|nr:unnamed protein product [Auanema sp. JU1783]
MASTFTPQENFQERAKALFEFDEVEPNVFKTSLLTTGSRNAVSAYGGLIFSQAVAAAEKTVDEKLKPHGLHSFFINAVNPQTPLQYCVRRLRDGRSFATRLVEAVQDDKLCFTLQASFQVIEDDTITHQDKMPEVPHWSSLMTIAEAVPWLTEKVDSGEKVVQAVIDRRLRNYDKATDYSKTLFEARPCDLGKYFAYSDDVSRTFYTWFRSKGDLTSDCEKLHRYLVCYNTDTIASCVYHPHYQNNFMPSLIFSLDHNVWLHHFNFRADEWLLFECTSPVARGSRGMSYGRLWTENGVLVLTCAQEVLVRTRDQSSRL